MHGANQSVRDASARASDPSRTPPDTRSTPPDARSTPPEAQQLELEAGQFPVDVVAQLIAAAGAVQANLDRRNAVNGQTAGATADIHSGLTEGRAMVRMMGAVVKRTARQDPGLLAAWRSAQRAKLKPGVAIRLANEVSGSER